MDYNNMDSSEEEQAIKSVIFIGSIFTLLMCIAICKEIINPPINDTIQQVENPTMNSNLTESLNDITLISNIKCLIKGECPICIEDFKENDELYKLRCGHIFHTECIEEWININRICPNCRDTVIRSDIV
tara:strand:- start:192 stop:581 length:390 start_codon:yes stop_codon:yes gene_type:complete